MLPCIISIAGGFAKQQKQRGNQLFFSEMADTDPTPLVHHSYEPNGSYFSSSGQYSSLLGFSPSWSDIKEEITVGILKGGRRFPFYCG